MPQNIVECIAVVVIPERQMGVNRCVSQWLYQLAEMSVVSGLTILQCQIPVDENTGWSHCFLGQFIDDLTQIRGDRGCSRLFFAYVSVVEDDDKILVDCVRIMLRLREALTSVRGETSGSIDYQTSPGNSKESPAS